MTNKIQVPATLDEAGHELRGINAVLNTRGWARAAIVYAFTHDEKPGEHWAKKRGEITTLSPRDFAGLQFPGLRSDQTVRHYRSAWQQAVDNGWTAAAVPGKPVTIPDADFPPAVRPAVVDGEQVEDRRPLDRARSDLRKLTPRQKADVYRELASDPEVRKAEITRHHELRAEMNPDALTNQADIKASHAVTREAFEPVMDSLANMQVVAAIEHATELLRAARPGEDLQAEIDIALAELQLARHELDFRMENER